jgi:hypothetical protein
MFEYLPRQMPALLSALGQRLGEALSEEGLQQQEAAVLQECLQVRLLHWWVRPDKLDTAGHCEPLHVMHDSAFFVCACMHCALPCPFTCDVHPRVAFACCSASYACNNTLEKSEPMKWLAQQFPAA